MTGKNMTEHWKMTTEVIKIAKTTYLAQRSQGVPKVEALLDDAGATNIKKLEALLAYCRQQKSPPAVLVQWATEALVRERACYDKCDGPDVEVCSACDRASCWHGEVYCEDHKSADTRTRWRSELIQMALDPHHFSQSKLQEVTGG